MEKIKNVCAADALEKLKKGNLEFLKTGKISGDYSAEKRKETEKNGQSPFAIVLTCSDSRVVPEVLFSCGIGDIFVIRTAGNVLGKSEAASIEYAAEHLGVNLAVVLGHTRCGAVSAALKGETQGNIGVITGDIIKAAEGVETELSLCEKNVSRQAEKIKSEFLALTVCKAVCDISSGKVDWII